MTELLSWLLNIAVPTFAVASMLSVGFSYTVRQIIAPLRSVRRVIRVLVANFVLVPLLAYIVVQVLSLDRSLEIGLILIATAAGAPFLITLTAAAAGDMALAAGLLVLVLVVTVVYMPFIVPLAVPEATVNTSGIAWSLSLTMLLPLIVAQFIEERSPHWASRLRPIAGKVSRVALIVLVVTICLLNLRAILNVFGTGAILAALLVIGGAFGIGHLLGGPDRGSRGVIGLATAQRNIAAATVVATENFHDPRTIVMVIISSLVGLAVLFPIAWGLRRGAQARARGTTAPMPAVRHRH